MTNDTLNFIDRASPEERQRIARRTVKFFRDAAILDLAPYSEAQEIHSSKSPSTCPWEPITSLTPSSRVCEEPSENLIVDGQGISGLMAFHTSRRWTIKPNMVAAFFHLGR